MNSDHGRSRTGDARDVLILELQGLWCMHRLSQSYKIPLILGSGMLFASFAGLAAASGVPCYTFNAVNGTTHISLNQVFEYEGYVWGLNYTTFTGTHVVPPVYITSDNLVVTEEGASFDFVHHQGVMNLKWNVEPDPDFAIAPYESGRTLYLTYKGSRQFLYSGNSGGQFLPGYDIHWDRNLVFFVAVEQTCYPNTASSSTASSDTTVPGNSTTSTMPSQTTSTLSEPSTSQTISTPSEPSTSQTTSTPSEPSTSRVACKARVTST